MISESTYQNKAQDENYDYIYDLYYRLFHDGLPNIFYHLTYYPSQCKLFLITCSLAYMENREVEYGKSNSVP